MARTMLRGWKAGGGWAWNGVVLIAAGLWLMMMGALAILGSRAPVPRLLTEPIVPGAAALVAVLDGALDATHLAHGTLDFLYRASVGCGVWVAGAGAVAAILCGARSLAWGRFGRTRWR